MSYWTTASTPKPSKCWRTQITTKHQIKIVPIILILHTMIVLTTAIIQILWNQARVVTRVLVYLHLKEKLKYTVVILISLITTILSSTQKKRGTFWICHLGLHHFLCQSKIYFLGESKKLSNQSNSCHENDQVCTK